MVVGANFELFFIFSDSHYKKCNGICFMSLSEILNKLQMCKVKNFMTFSDGLLIYVILPINHTHNFLIFSRNFSYKCYTRYK